MSISNSFAAGVLGAVGKERAELILASAPGYLMLDIGILPEPTTMIVIRYLAVNEQRLKAGMFAMIGTQRDWAYAGLQDLSRGSFFFPEFRPIFPNGWADV